MNEINSVILNFQLSYSKSVKGYFKNLKSQKRIFQKKKTQSKTQL